MAAPFEASGSLYAWIFFSPGLDQSLADAIVQDTITIVALGRDTGCEGFQSTAKHFSVNFQNRLLSIISYIFILFFSE